ncbi:Ig-like domain-containing protein [Chitinophaga sedimenti]|nr:Ig-like domain-containing protein [Chitinophaga sedimenti]
MIEKLIVSPTLKRTPTITAKLRTVTIAIKDTLKPNTTYTFNFNDAIRDLNERNPIEDFQYVVSTGDYLDSLQITGTTYQAETGQIDSTIGVFLYASMEDSIVSKEKPLYYARSKGDGSFRFKTWRLAVIRYLHLRKKIVTCSTHSTRSRLRLWIVPSCWEPIFQGSTWRCSGERYRGHSSTRRSTGAGRAQRRRKKKLPKFLASAKLEGGQQDLGEPMLVGFTIPVRMLDSTKILLLEDTSLIRVPIMAKMDDTTRQTLVVNYNWKEGKPYQLILPKDFATDTLNQTFAKADTIKFNSKERSDYGTVTLSFKITDTTYLKMKDTIDFVVQLVSGKEVKYTGNINSGSRKRDLIKPGQYDIRILVDENKNGIWDTGIYYGKPKKQPEKVFPFPKQVNIKPNWSINDGLTL